MTSRSKKSTKRCAASLAERAASSRLVQAYNQLELPHSDEALAALLEHVAVEPWNPILLGILGQMRRLRKEYKEACSAWSQAIAQWTGHDDGPTGALRENIAEVRALVGDNNESLREYKEAAACYGRARAKDVPEIAADNYKWREAYCLVKVGDVGRAMELLAEIRQGPNGALFESDIVTLERDMR